MRDVQILKPVGYGMDERAAECVRKWRFKPGTKDGAPVDVAFRFGYEFRLAPQPRMWGAGPLIFGPDSGVTPPVLKSGAAPAAERQLGDEIVLLQFTVGPTGQVSELMPIEGRESTSLSL